MLRLGNSFFCVHFILLLIPFVQALIPSFCPVCLRDDPAISDCVINAINDLKPKIIAGDFGRDFWIPKIDPFYLQKVIYGSDSSLKIIFTNVYATGGSSFKIEKLHVDVNDLKFDVIVFLPRIDLRSDYKMSLNLFGAMIRSEGKMYEVLTNIKLRGIVKGNIYIKNGKEYIKFEPIYMKILQNTINFMDFTNFLPKTSYIGPFVKNLIINNAEYLKKNIYPFFEQVMSDTVTPMANKIASQGSYDEFFPY